MKKILIQIAAIFFLGTTFTQVGQTAPRSNPSTPEIIRNINFTFFHRQRTDHYLRLYFFPSYPIAMNWSSPRSLLDSSMDGIVSNPNHPIGHVNVEIHCRLSDTEVYHVMAGATSEESNHSARLLLREKVGFSILERSWPGAYENIEEILESFEGRVADGEPISAVTYLVSRENCERLREFHDTMMANPEPTYYGFSARPRFNEGGGCSAFAASFVEVAGIMNSSLFVSWTQSRRVPFSLMGGYEVEKISIMEVRESIHSARWAKASEPHMALTVYDPDQMHAWAHRHDLDGYRDPIAKDNSIRALVFDYRGRSAPHEPIFLGEPDLLPLGREMWVRKGKQLRSDGSFEMLPH